MWNSLTPPPVFCCTQLQVVTRDSLCRVSSSTKEAQAQSAGLHLGLYLMMSDPCAALRRRHRCQNLTSLRRTSKAGFSSCGLSTLMLHA